MWTLLSTMYVVGLIATALSLRRGRSFEAGRVVDATCSLLWPLYWGILTLYAFRNRRSARRI